MKVNDDQEANSKKSWRIYVHPDPRDSDIDDPILIDTDDGEASDYDSEDAFIFRKWKWRIMDRI